MDLNRYTKKQLIKIIESEKKKYLEEIEYYKNKYMKQTAENVRLRKILKENNIKF